MIPYTEAANAITANIDVSPSSEIVRKLAYCDYEMFQPNASNGNAKTLYDESILQSIVSVAKTVNTVLRCGEESDKSMIVMGGCGTSGRIAFLITRSFNDWFGFDFTKITYTIAGGDKALFTSQEAPEDDYQAGIADLLKVSRGMDRVVYIGITCGLSAPYVAGQLDHCMKNLNTFIPVLLGFNPVHLARNVPISGWDKTFLDVARKLEPLVKSGRGFIINPVLLGEAVTGSSRMKGGSMTKIILETIFLLSTVESFNRSVYQLCKAMLTGYSIAYRQLYESCSDFISTVVQSAGDSLKVQSSVYQVSSNGIGVLGIIDATECPPTYGASTQDVRGFVVGGYSEFGNSDGDIGQLKYKDVLFPLRVSSPRTIWKSLAMILHKSFSVALRSRFNSSMCATVNGTRDHKYLVENKSFVIAKGEEFKIGASDLAKLLEASDRSKEGANNSTVLVVSTADDSNVVRLLQETEELGKNLKRHCNENTRANRVWILQLLREGEVEQTLPKHFKNVGRFCLKQHELLPAAICSSLPERTREKYVQCVVESCSKLIFNNISTGAHIIKGKIFKNSMVDLKVSNQKLFHRSIGIVRKFCPDLNENEARAFLIRSIHEADQLDEETETAPVSSHILVATPKEKVVPTAIVMARKRCTFAEAASALSRFHVIRDAMASVTGQQSAEAGSENTQ